MSSVIDSILAATNLWCLYFIDKLIIQIKFYVFLDFKDYNLISLLSEQNNLSHKVFFCILLSWLSFNSLF